MEPQESLSQDKLRIIEKCSDVPLYVHSIRQIKQQRIQLDDLPIDRRVTSKSLACCLTELTYVLYNMHQLNAGAMTVQCRRQPTMPVQPGQTAQLEDTMHIQYSIKASKSQSFSMELMDIFKQYFQRRIAMLKLDETKSQLEKLGNEVKEKATHYRDRREEFIKCLQQSDVFIRHSRLLEISNNSLLQRMTTAKWASGQNGIDELKVRWRMEKCSTFISLEELVEQAQTKFKGKTGAIQKYILENTRTSKGHVHCENKERQQQLQEQMEEQWQKDNIVNMLKHLDIKEITESDPTTKSARAKVSLLFEYVCGKETLKFQILFDPDKGRRWVIVKLFGPLPLREKESIDNVLHNCVFINQRLPGEYSLSVVDIVDFGKCLCIKMQSQINMRQTLVDRVIVLMETALLAYRIVRQDVQLPDIHRYEKQVFDSRKYIDHYTSYFHCIYNSLFVDSPQ